MKKKIDQIRFDKGSNISNAHISLRGRCSAMGVRALAVRTQIAL